VTLTPALSLRERGKGGSALNLSLCTICPLSLREREKGGSALGLSLCTICPLSLRERVRVRVTGG